MSTSNAPVDLTALVPVFDERESLQELHERLSEVCAGAVETYEILFVDDGSTDGSREALADLASADGHVALISFRRNFGKAAALDAGFRHARGRIIITLDADLQDDPKEIPRFLEALEDGADLVSGWKVTRHDPLGKVLPSRVFNAVVGAMSGVRLHDHNCGFKAYRREAVEGLQLYGELHRFIPVLVRARGFRVSEISVEHHPRRFGHSKYGMKRLAKGCFDFLTVLLETRFATRPLHLFGGLGSVFSFAGFLILLGLTIGWFMGYPVSGRPLFFLGILLMVLGAQWFSTGLVAELLIRHECRFTPAYLISEYLPSGSGRGAEESADG